ncbi:PAS domain-containing protein [Flavitalea sp.]|nr:PAS domain-containing protein [Flavitalea sp.]
MTELNETVEQLKTILNKQDARGLDNLINSKLYAAINPVVDKLSELINLQVRVGNEIHKENALVYQTALKQFIFIVLLSLVLAVPFSYYLVGNINHLIENLHQENKNLERSEAKYRTLIEYAGDAIFVFNTETRIVDANEYACRLLE